HCVLHWLTSAEGTGHIASRAPDKLDFRPPREQRLRKDWGIRRDGGSKKDPPVVAAKGGRKRGQ
ncbi:unnamed protein product, partial [Sphacelaria rigidula]